MSPYFFVKKRLEVIYSHIIKVSPSIAMCTF